MKGIRVGYKRVSTPEQNPDLQLVGVQLDRVYIDVASGKSCVRPQFEEMMRFVREGDTVIVSSMDRLARNVYDLRKIVNTLNEKGVCVQFIRENLTFSGEDSAMSVLILSLMGAFAEFERTIMLERQRDAIALAKAQGKYKGRKASLSEDQIKEVKNKLEMGLSKSRVAKQYKVSRMTIYRVIN